MKKVSLFVLLLVLGAGFLTSALAAPLGGGSAQVCGRNPCSLGQVPLGSVGPAGPAGPRGMTGATGAPGSRGEVGPAGPTDMIYLIPGRSVTIRCPSAYLLDSYGSGGNTARLNCFWGTTSPTSVTPVNCSPGDAPVTYSVPHQIRLMNSSNGLVTINDRSGAITMANVVAGAGTEEGYVNYTAMPLATCMNTHCTVDPSDPSCSSSP